ncbi:MAG TPA: nicotinate-nucleotide adenylyltransferase [Gemmatimonadales bacterium]|nr:nicotinate-nucleotide adenylyltransferase [Gemmatimonadales bacterium]
MVGLFGGSFDPIHHGHLLVGLAAVETLGLESLRFVPAHTQPFKAGRHGAAPEQRAAMVALAIAGEPRFALERIELDRGGPSYTVDTLRALRAREPDVEFALLVGADAAVEMPSWREAEALPGLARVVALSRAGDPAPVNPMVWRTLSVPAIDISATDIRARVRSGASICWRVPDAVARYIAAERLYLNQEP